MIDFTSATSAYRAAGKIAGDSAPVENVPFTGTGDKAGNAGPSFSNMVASALDGAIDTAYKGESMSKLALANKAELHELVTAVSAAEVSVQTVVAVRDRIISAYQDIMKMPI